MTVVLKKRLVPAQFAPSICFQTISLVLKQQLLTHGFDQIPTHDAGDGTTEITWISEDGRCLVFASCDSVNRIIRIDISADSDAIADSVAAALSRDIPMARFQEELEKAADLPSAELEAALIRLGQMSPIDAPPELFVTLMSRAFTSSDAGVRRAATFVSYLVQCSAFTTLLERAAVHEQDANLSELMQATQEAIGPLPGPTATWL
ncbi:hypothetical protein NBRC116594_09430 [Shimia sp. NS0008-38b]|uniref:hypothetical protein n=1 Tax=Shimia sp. NS0008-38b TaxID=3127653 RepID=UPI003101C130